MKVNTLQHVEILETMTFSYTETNSFIQHSRLSEHDYTEQTTTITTVITHFSNPKKTGKKKKKNKNCPSYSLADAILCME